MAMPFGPICRLPFYRPAIYNWQWVKMNNEFELTRAFHECYLSSLAKGVAHLFFIHLSGAAGYRTLVHKTSPYVSSIINFFGSMIVRPQYMIHSF